MLVLPTLPVMPTTVGRRARDRAHAARSISAVAGVGDDDDRQRRPPSAGRTASAAAGAGARRVADEVVAVALGDDRHEQLAGPQRRGSRTRRRRARRPARRGRRRWPRPRRMPGTSRRRTVPSGASVQRRCHGAATGSTSSCCSAGSRPSTTSAASRPPTCSRAIDPARYRVTPIGISTDGEWALAEGAARALGRRARRAARPGSTRPAPSIVAGVALVADASPGETHGRAAAAARPDGRGRHGAGPARARRRRLRRRRRARLGAGDGQGDGQAGARRQRHPPGPLPGVRRPPAHAGPAGRAGRRARPAVLRQAVEHGLVGRRDARPTTSRSCATPSSTPSPTTSGSSSRRPSSAGRSRSPCSAASHPEASGAGEIVPGAEFYDYEDKYVTDGAQLLDPGAAVGRARPTRCGPSPCACSRSLRCDGLARVDFFFEEGGRGFLCNEANTMPGFTPISMYPKLWQAAGVSLPRADRPPRRARHRAPRPPPPQHQALTTFGACPPSTA